MLVIDRRGGQMQASHGSDAGPHRPVALTTCSVLIEPFSVCTSTTSPAGDSLIPSYSGVRVDGDAHLAEQACH